MSLVIVILCVMWLYSFISFKANMKSYKYLVLYLEHQLCNVGKSHRLLLSLASAYMLYQKYMSAYKIYEYLLSTGYNDDGILANMEFCKNPCPGYSGLRNMNDSWLHNFILVRLGRRRRIDVTEDDMLNANQYRRFNAR